MARRKKKKRDVYINQKDLAAELMAWKGSGVLNDKLGAMMMRIVDGLGQKKNFSGYTYLEEMKGLATEFLVKYARNFDINKKNANAFSYCTQIAYCGFIQYIQKEKKQSSIKQAVYEKLVTQGGWATKNNPCPFEAYLRKSGEGNRIKDDVISDLIEDYDSLIDILKQEILEKVKCQE